MMVNMVTPFCLAPHATAHEAKDTGQCLNVVGRQVKLKSSPPLREANMIKPHTETEQGMSSTFQPERQW